MAEIPATPQPTPNNRPIAGALWMLATGFSFVAVTAIVKHGAQDLPAAQSAFLRYVLGLVFLLPMIGPMRRARLTPRQLRLFTMRGAAHTIGVILWFYAMTRITIAEVTAMNYMTPIYITLGAAVFLGERLAVRRIIAILLAFAGALIILRPGIREITDGHIGMIGTAIFFAVSYLTAKRMADEVNALVVVGMLSITVTIGLAPFAFAVWRTPTPEELFWMFLVALFATLGHYTMTRAFAVAPVTVTQPITFLQLLWSVLLGALFFGEPADIWVILGGTVILGSATFITIREAMLKRRTRSSAANGEPAEFGSEPQTKPQIP
ncbi:DMT family transporter [Silicimonas sp. MF1-12-2]|uniref:DMT family transporter n=1 Tax=Silicimonas sp. MF1-12-2 TaxID=3384793 RepID=UPI0039B5164E